MSNWEFLPNPGGEEEGLGHAGIETFKGSPYPGIARECSQNSLDAAAKLQDGSARRVHVVFRHLDLPAAQVPGLESLILTLRACLEQARLRGSKKDKEFFERAIAVASQARIPILCVEDYGTTGLIGPAEPGTPFYALVKSSGVSQKVESDAAGSFGIGKNAAFAVSSLRTVFYSTLYADGPNGVHLAQGKSILVSHKGEDGVARRATGYWGAAGYKPISQESRIPDWLRRSEVGTTVASIGFVEESNWYWQMVESLIRNFFAAIHNDAIRFTVLGSSGEPVEINAGALVDLFSLPEVRLASESAGSTEDLEFSAAMLTALSSPDAEEMKKTLHGIGTFRARLLQRDGFPKRVGILRNGMYITDNLRHFGHPLARFNLSRDFVVTVEPDDRSAGGQIRDMESPKHDEISAERVDDLQKRNELKRGMKALGSWIRELIRAATTKPAEAEILLDEMNRFFSRPSAGPSIPDPANQNDDPQQIKIVPKAASDRVAVGRGPEGESGSAGGVSANGTGGGKTTGDRAGKGRGVRGGRGGKSILYSGLRNSVPASNKGTAREIAFTPNASGPAQLEVLAVGVASDEPVSIRSIDGVPCSKCPKIDFVEGRRTHLRVEFETPYAGPIRLILTEVQGEADAN